MRCGSRLVSAGDGKDKVRTLCGEPTDIALRGVVRRSPSYRYGSWPYEHEYYGPGWEDLPVEIWTYNLGSHKLLRKLRFVGDRTRGNRDGRLRLLSRSADSDQPTRSAAPQRGRRPR